MIELRSDTFTQPSAAMYEALTRADLGDDVYGEDLTVAELEALAAARTGKEAALLLSSGTQGNLVALMTHCERGAEVIVGATTDLYNYEVSGMSSVAGLMPRPLDDTRGHLDPDAVATAIRPDDVHAGRTGAICVETSHQRSGGRPMPLDVLRRIRVVADDAGAAVHMDGARLFNAAIALGVSGAQVTADADSVTFCLSKGLSAPVGSMLCGRAEFVARARRNRKMLGGGMRQAGWIAAAGIVALRDGTERLADDHANALVLARGLAAIPGIVLDPKDVPTNIVYFHLADDAPGAATLVASLEREGVRAFPMGERLVRMVTHRGITRQDAEDAITATARAIATAASAPHVSAAAGPYASIAVKDRGPKERPVATAVDAYWLAFLETEPLFATQVGEDAFGDRLPDPSDTGRSTRSALHRGFLTEAQRLRAAGVLDEEDDATLSSAEALARRELAFAEADMDRLWSVNHMIAGHRVGPGGLVSFLVTTQPLATSEQRDTYLGRLSAVPSYLRSLGEAAHRGVATGFVAPLPSLRRTLHQVERLLEIPADQSSLVTAVPPDAQAARDAVTRVVAEDVMPAYAAFRELLVDLLTSAREGLGLCWIPGGADAYVGEIAGWTTTDRTADDLHAQGLDLLAEVQEERAAAAARLGHSDAGEAARPRGADSELADRAVIVAMARRQVSTSWDALPGWFGRLPAANCVVMPVDASQEDDVLDHYRPGSADRPGVYFVNSKPPRMGHELASTTYHEANPGHHLQCALEFEASHRPALRRFAAELHGAAYAEGWGLYSERLADEMGLYVDEYERLGMLELQALRTARLVVDTGIHSRGWSRDRAVEVLASTDLKSDWVQAEVDRYAAIPGQALSYRVGQLEIEDLRSRWEQTGRPLKDFHDRVMALGSVPLTVLRRSIESALIDGEVLP